MGRIKRTIELEYFRKPTEFEIQYEKDYFLINSDSLVIIIDLCSSETVIAPISEIIRNHNIGGSC